jgi:succinoglycan biosynthesis protein ExoM
MATLSIIIPTQRRPEPLALAARSIFAQTGVDFGGLELVIVDNDAAGSGQSTAQTLSAEAPLPVIYVHEPQSGVANARNAGMAAATGALIAFLDDDEEAPPGWLAALIAAQKTFNADVVFGPVRGRAPEGPLAHRAYLEDFFSRTGPAEAGVIADYYGCGCSLVRRAALVDPAAPFSIARNQYGGEDDLLFGDMKAAGARFAWAPDAWVWEDPAADRLSLAYALTRAFAYGQGPTFHCATASPPDVTGVARWMLVGLIQVGIYAPLAAAEWLFQTPRRAFALDRVARALGKVFWWGPFKLRFYGVSLP